MAHRLNGVSCKTLLVAAVVGCAMAPAAFAQPAGQAAADPAAVVEARQTQMKRLKDVMKTVTGYVKDGAGTPADVKAAALVASDVASKVPNLYPKGTQVGVGKSETLPAAWEQWDKFLAANKAMGEAGVKLAAAADTGNKDAIAGAFKGLGASCGACHDNFRQKK
ncbi:MAG TPA: cytochrome c [Azospirillaceae bacterium]|nr:cytochrome c [Azospirillaceae bacterium]